MVLLGGLDGCFISQLTHFILLRLRPVNDYFPPSCLEMDIFLGGEMVRARLASRDSLGICLETVGRLEVRHVIGKRDSFILHL